MERSVTSSCARTPGCSPCERDGDRVRVATAAPATVLRHWLATADTVADLRVDGASLDDALLALTDPPATVVAA